MGTSEHTQRAHADAPQGVWKATGLEPQVFLDRSGRRARRVGAAGVIAALLSAGWLGGVVGGSAGFASLPALRATALVAHANAGRGVARLTSRRARTHHRRTHTVEVADVTSTKG